MPHTDPSSKPLQTLAEGWPALTLLHERVQATLERMLVASHGLSVREFSLLDLLSQQHRGEGGHLPMGHVARAVVLSQSAATRLVTRLEDRELLSRCLCPTDKRGIYTNVTPAGFALLNEARITYRTALDQALAEVAEESQLASLLKALGEIEFPRLKSPFTPPPAE